MKRLAGWAATAGLLGVCALASQAAELATGQPDPMAKVRGLLDRWGAGELTAAEKDELLRSLATQMLRTGPLEKPASPQGSQAAPGSEHSADKVIAVYPDRNTTQLVIEARQPLVAGSLVYAGPEELQVTLDDVLARSGDLYYYSASVAGKPRIYVNDAVVTQKKRVIETPSALTLKIQETYTFEQKRLGEITAVQDGRAMIDRGTLHEVRERDIYKVFDSSGGYKGFLEIRGIGDLQSSGVLYNRMEDRRRLALQTAPGDRTVFVGQRKLLALGALVGLPLKRKTEFSSREKAIGGGLAWDLMFKNGWGAELLFGWFEREIKGAENVRRGPIIEQDLQEISWKVSYYAPFVFRKNFYFPSVVSPFVVAGGTVIDAKLKFHDFHFSTRVFPNYISDVEYEDSETMIAPVLGAGVDFFPARLIRPRIEFRWIDGPTLHAGHKTLNTEMGLLSVSLFSAW